MSKQRLLNVVLGVLIGMNLTAGAWIYREVSSGGATPFAFGQTAMSGAISLATGRVQGKGDAAALYIYDAEKQKLAVVFVNNNNLELMAVRDMQYDWRVDAFTNKNGRQSPTVKEMKNYTRKKK